MHKTTKAVVAGFAALLVAGAFVSCGGGSGANANVDKELAKEFKDYKVEKDPTTKKVYNFDGMDVHINSHWWNPDGQMSIAPTTPAAELYQQFHTYLMQNYNLKIDEYGGLGGWGDWPELIANYCTTGGDENYLFIADSRSLGSGIQNGLFYDWSKAKDVDLSKSKWDGGVKSRASKGSSVYGVRGVASEPRGGVFFNKRLLKEAGIDPDSIYDMQKNGTWTWDTFEEMLKKVTRDTDNDGVIDVWGTAYNTGYIGSYAVLTNGTTSVYKDASGKYVNGFGSDAVTEAAEFAQRVFKNYTKPQPEGSNWDWFFSAFLNGEIVFSIEQEYNVSGTYKDMADDWGFVCFPLGPRAEKGKYGNMADDWYIIIPAIYGDEKCAKLAKAYDFWTDPVPGLSDDAWKDDYYTFFRDSRGVDETLQYMRDVSYSDMAGDIPGLQTGDYWWTVVPGGATPQEQYEATKNNFDALINKMN